MGGSGPDLADEFITDVSELLVLPLPPLHLSLQRCCQHLRLPQPGGQLSDLLVLYRGGEINQSIL